MPDGPVMVSNHVQQMSANGVKTIVAGNPTVFVKHFEQVQALGGALRKAEISYCLVRRPGRIAIGNVTFLACQK